MNKVNNTLDIANVSLDLIFDFDSNEEIKKWTEFITYLYTSEYVILNGKSDISLKLHFKKGNYTKSPVSLFTYYKKDKKMVFQSFR